MDCIRCNIRMNKEIKNGVLIDVCPICDGVWLDDHELEMLKNGESKAYSQLLKDLYSENTIDSERKPIAGMCPRCLESSLKVSLLHGVEIDHCPNCKGIFFDWGELEEVIHANS